MLCDETAESAGKDARELGAALVGAHAFRVTPGVRFDVFVVGHGHYGDPAKRGPSEMTYGPPPDSWTPLTGRIAPA